MLGNKGGAAEGNEGGGEEWVLEAGVPRYREFAGKLKLANQTRISVQLDSNFN